MLTRLHGKRGSITLHVWVSKRAPIKFCFQCHIKNLKKMQNWWLLIHQALKDYCFYHITVWRPKAILSNKNVKMAYLLTVSFVTTIFCIFTSNSSILRGGIHKPAFQVLHKNKLDILLTVCFWVVLDKVYNIKQLNLLIRGEKTPNVYKGQRHRRRGAYLGI